MKKSRSEWLRPQWLHAGLSLWLALLAPAGTSALAQIQQPPAPGLTASSDPAPLRLEHVAHVIGLEGLKPNVSGDLVFDKAKMVFTANGTPVAVPFHSILAFSIAHEDVALIGGAKGAVAGMAPYGVGQVISAIRPSADTMTLLYTDRFHAIHGSILILPKGAADSVIAALAEAKISPSEYPKSGQLGSFEAAIHSVAASRTDTHRTQPSVVVTPLTESVDGIPSEFPVAEYEDLVSQLTESGLFARVWRQGDVRRDPDALVLAINIEDLKKGSARTRGLVPFAGATVIKASVALTDVSGRTVFQAEIRGAKRMRGENLDATNSLSKRVRKELKKVPDLQTR